MTYRVIANGHTKYFGIYLVEALKVYDAWQRVGYATYLYRYDSYYYEA